MTVSHNVTSQVTNKSSGLSKEQYQGNQNLSLIGDTTENSRSDKKSNGNPDYSTLGRLKKNISELGNMINEMDNEEMERLNRKYLIHVNAVKQVDERKKARSDGNINTCTDLVIRESSKIRVHDPLQMWFSVWRLRLLLFTLELIRFE